VIYHSPCCTLGGLSTLNLLNGNAIFAYAAKEGQSLGVESGSGKSTDPVMSKGWNKSENSLQYITLFFIP